MWTDLASRHYVGVDFIDAFRIDYMYKHALTIVAPCVNGTAAGTLYVDDGVSMVQERSTDMEMTDVDKLCIYGSFEFDVGVKVASVVLFSWGSRLPPSPARLGGKSRSHMTPGMMC